MTGRNIFTEFEKSCLQQLIIKHKLNTSADMRNLSMRKMAWERLTLEYNSIKLHKKRTLAQLKKCWDNMKTKRKQALAEKKKQMMIRSGGETLSHTSFQDSFEDTMIQNVANHEQSCDVDSGTPLDNQAGYSQPSSDHGPSAIDALNIENASCDSNVQINGDSGAGTSNFINEAKGGNVRINAEEFSLKEDIKTLTNQERENELHKLKIKEREFLVRAAEEVYLKSKIERQCASEMLKYATIKRIEAELNLEILKNKL